MSVMKEIDNIRSSLLSKNGLVSDEKKEEF